MHGLSDATGPLRFRRDLTVHEIDEEALVHDAVTANTHHLNATAFFIWRNCNGWRDLPRLAERLCRRFDVSFPVASVHVERICGEFRRNGLLEKADSSAEAQTR